MHDWIIAHEPGLRLAAFASVLLLLLATEARWPRRAGPMRRGLRWSANLPMVIVDTLFVRVLVPLGATGAALWAQGRELGLLHQVEAPRALEALLAFLAFDLLIYWQHRFFHRVPTLWRLHRMHHSDVEFDVTTAVRFHPAEILLSVLIKMGAVLALGAPAIAVIVFEVMLNASAMFNHANLALPQRFDRLLRWIIVTPDMHRVHHSHHRREHDSNYGFNLPWWDHLFGSYTDQPADGHAGMVIGLTQFREAPGQRLWPLLVQPLRPLGPERAKAAANAA